MPPFDVKGEPFEAVKHELRLMEQAAAAATTQKDCSIIVSMEKDQPETVCRLEHIIGSNPQVARWEATHLRPKIEAIVGERLYLFKDKLNLKLPGGGAFGPHQDHAAYQHFKPPRFFTAMIAVDPMTIENGCLEFAMNFTDVAARYDATTGTPQETLLPISEHPSSFGDILPEIAREFEWHHIIAPSGNGLVFDGFMPHRSPVNKSSKARRTLFLTYNQAIYGNHYSFYYQRKMACPNDPIFHISTPTRR